MNHSHFIRKGRPANTYYITLYNILMLLSEFYMGTLKTAITFPVGIRKFFFFSKYVTFDRDSKIQVDDFQTEKKGYSNLNVSLKNRGLHRPDGRW